MRYDLICVQSAVYFNQLVISPVANFLKSQMQFMIAVICLAGAIDA